MAFTQETFAPIGANAAPCPALYSYSSLDDLSTVTTSQYFLAKQPQLDEGDWIMAYLSDGHAILEVSTDTSTVTIINVAASTEPIVQRFSDAGVISDTTTLVISTGNHIIDLPLIYSLIIDIRSNSGTAILDPGTNTIGTNTVTAATSRRLWLDPTVNAWLDL